MVQEGRSRLGQLRFAGRSVVHEEPVPPGVVHLSSSIVIGVQVGLRALLEVGQGLGNLLLDGCKRSLSGFELSLSIQLGSRDP
ncbi:MAG: hypothetical protein GY745_21270 [Actinomycetia bacterium]|nr:hypothetical protein [Actinomycetes bacterium]